MARILLLSYDPTLLTTRRLLLENQGYEIISARGLAAALQLCDGTTQFDLIILDHPVPQTDQRGVVAALRKNGCDAPVLSLLRLNEYPTPEAAYAVDSGDPKAMLETVETALADYRLKLTRSA